MATVSDPRFDTQDPRFDREYEQMAPPKGRSPWRTCLIGCLVILVVGMLFVAAMVYWVWANWRDFAAGGATEAMNQMIDATDLPAEERRDMKLEVRRVADAFRDGKLSSEQLMQIVQEVADSPLMTMFVVAGIEKQYLGKSGLSDEEKTEGRRTLKRFVRGAMDDAIDKQEVDAVMSHVGEKRPDGTWQLRQQVSDDELRAALAEAKRVADEAGIPAQPESIDASAEFKRIVDKAMGESREPEAESEAVEAGSEEQGAKSTEQGPEDGE